MPAKEAQARIKINKLLEAAGWRFFDDDQGRANVVLEPNVTLTKAQVDAMGSDFETSGKGFIDFLVSNATGSTNSRMRVKPASSLDYEFLLPPSFVLDDFCRLVSPMIDQIQGNLLEMRMLRNTIPISVAKLMSSSR